MFQFSPKSVMLNNKLEEEMNLKFSRTSFGGQCNALHFSGMRALSVDESDLEEFGLSAINPFAMSHDQLKEVYDSIAEKMNILWSSTGGIPSFPERRNGKQKIFYYDNMIQFAGEGWHVSYYRNGFDKWREWNKANINNMLYNAEAFVERKYIPI